MAGHSDIADVTLLLEGSYPFVRGGVSAWVHQLIEGLPELRFSLVYLGAQAQDADQVRYLLPDNVLNLDCHYLMEVPAQGEPRMRTGDHAYFSDSARLHDWFRCPEGVPDQGLLERVLLHAGQDAEACAQDFFHSEAAWTQINESYTRYELVRSLRLENRIRFLGFQQIEHVLPKLGLLVLTSIGEAFPLVIGESLASGWPVVATDVGACRELIEGKDQADCQLVAVDRRLAGDRHAECAPAAAIAIRRPVPGVGHLPDGAVAGVDRSAAAPFYALRSRPHG